MAINRRILFDDHHCTLDEIAEALYKEGLTDRVFSHEAVRLIEKRAIEKVRARLWDHRPQLDQRDCHATLSRDSH